MVLNLDEGQELISLYMRLLGAINENRAAPLHGGQDLNAVICPR
jgi:hypothetical protein